MTKLEHKMCEKHELIITNLDITVRNWEYLTTPTSYSDGKTLPHNSAHSARLRMTCVVVLQ